MRLDVDDSSPIGRIDVRSDDFYSAGSHEEVVPFPSALGVGTIQRLTLNPLLFVMLHRYTLSQDVQLRRQAEPADQPVITFSFRNMLRPTASTHLDQAAAGSRNRLPAVQVSSSDMDLALFFPANTLIDTIIIGVHVALLKQLLGPQADHPISQTMLAGHHSYLYEELGSLTIQQLAVDIMTHSMSDPLLIFYLTVKAQELVYQFMSELLQRESRPLYALRDDDANRLLAIRDRSVSDLSQAPNVPELALLAGMSESKLRRLFRQIFGISLYAYYQTVRMQEAARLLREDKLSVSETGYHLGFTNLSHFTRVFERHVGYKPKQYARLR